MTKLAQLEQLVAKYQGDLAYYHSKKYNETQLRTDFLDPLFTLLGWDIINAQGRPTNEREVLVEEGLKARSGENAKKPDYTFRLFSERKFFVEAKKPSVDITLDPEPARQVRRYGFTGKLKISVLTNFEYTAIYDCSTPVSQDDAASHSRIKLWHYTELAENLEELLALTGRDSVYSGQFDNEWAAIESKILRFSVDDLFLKQINSWRLMLAKEFLTLKPDLSAEALNDLTQNYINCIVFLRVCEDRDLEAYETLWSLAQKADYPALVKTLRASDKKYDSGLFALEYIDELIGNENSAIREIINQLYFPQSTYSFAVFSSDILGSIYEIFLSEKIVIGPDGTPEMRPKEEHLERDVVTTPVHIIKEIIRNTVAPFCQGKSDQQILSARFADIACGSGAFLLEVFQYLQDTLVDYYLVHDRSQLQQLSAHSFKLKFSVKKALLSRCIYGIDKDYNAVKACAFGLLLKVLEGESKETIGSETPILPKLHQNILFGNSLVEPDDGVSQANLCQINPLRLAETRFDVIVGNPPYLATEHMKQFTPAELPLYKKRYQSAYKQFDKYFLFVERAMQLLNEEGWLGYILPSKFMKIGAGKNLRKLLAESGYLHTLVSFGSHQVFLNKTTYTCLLCLQKAPHDTFAFYEVKDVKKWLTREGNSSLSSVHEADRLDSDTWVLESETNAILQRIFSKSAALGEILGKGAIANGIQTSANEYYVHKPLRRENGYVWFCYDGVEYQVEEALTRPYFETPRSGEDNFYSYKDVEPNAIVLYPYRKVDGRVRFIDYDDLKAHYPHMFAFLQVVKPFLDDGKRSIKPDPTTPNEWYRYGRSQALENCDVPQKIIVGVLAKGYKYAIDNHRTFVSSGGTAGYSIINVPDGCPYSIFYIQALLNSRHLEWFATLYGEIFRGGFIARGTKIQTRMPVPVIDFTDPASVARHTAIAELQRQMNQLYGQIAGASARDKIVLQRQFAAWQAQMDTLIAALFDLGELDAKIPAVEALYQGL